MTMFCKGICLELRVKCKGYTETHLRCSNCECYFNANKGDRCPCCRVLLRCRPRNNDYYKKSKDRIKPVAI